MEQKHTPGPWSIDQYRSIKTANGETLLLGGIVTPMTLGDSMREGWANARRIVACVNACEGIDTEQLERHYNAGGGIDSAMEESALRDQVAVCKQRDMLLEALECIANSQLLPSKGDPTVLREYAMHIIATANGKK